MVYRLAVRMLGAAGAEADDACQEVFMRVHRSLGSYDATRPMAPWVARIAYHVCLRRVQRLGRQADRPDGATLELAVDDRQRGPEELAQSREASRLLMGALEQLSVQDRALLSLRYREGLSDAEVAEAVGMPVNTVKTRIFRARGKLRKMLGPTMQS